MSRRKAFWGDSGATVRQVPGMIADRFLDAEVSGFGLRLTERVTAKQTRWIPWAELNRVANCPPESCATVAPLPEKIGRGIRIVEAEEATK